MFTLREQFFSHVAQTSDTPLAFNVSSAKKEYLYDENGNAYLDCISGIAVSNIGHSHPAIMEAIEKQSKSYLHTMVYGEHIQSSQVLLAQKLSSLTNGLLNAVYFVNSGAEAVEGSLKLARRYTGRKKIISFRNAYHGSTLGAMSLLTDDENYEAYGPFLQQVQHINFNKTDELSCIDTDTACVIVEPVQGEAGYIPATYEFLMALRKKCTDTGCLLIFDEIQSGMGRTGSFFAYQNYQVIPDVLLLAKALGGGLPLGAFLADKKIMDVFTHHPILGHMTTFGGNPLCCATSLAAIQVIEKENLLKDMDVKEKLFKELLTDTRIHEVRGIGLMIAVQLSSFEEVQKVIQYAFNKNVLLDWFLYNNSAIRIAPPLTISENQIREVCEVIIKGVSKI